MAPGSPPFAALAGGPPLDLDELRSFVVLAGERHFGRAAEALAITQPALSKRLHRLEDQVGGPLLVRRYREVTLTEAGRVLLERARSLLAGAEEAVDLSRRAVRGEVGQLRIGFGTASVLGLLPQVLERFRRDHPGVRLDLRDMPSAEQVAALRADELDLGFPRLPLRDPEFATLNLIHQRLDAVTLVRSAWSDRVGLPSLAREPFLIGTRGLSAGYYDHVQALCRRAGFSPRVVSETNDLFSLLQLVRAGLGVALVPTALHAMRVPGIRFHRIDDPEAAWDIALAWRRRGESRQPLVEAFVGIARAVYAQAKQRPR